MEQWKKRVAVAVTVGLLVVSPVIAGGVQDTDQSGSSGPLVVYSPQSEDDVAFMEAAAEEALGFDVEFLRMDGGEAADRLIAEKNNPQADVVLGFVPAAMYQLKTEGIFQSYVPAWADALAPVYKDTDGMFHEFWQTPIVLAYNAGAISADEAPHSWLDLADERYREQYVLGQLAWQTTRTYMAGILWRFYDPATGEVSDAGWDYLRALYENALVLPEGKDMYEAIAAGTTSVVLHWYGGVNNGARNYDLDMQFINTEGGTPVIAEGIGIVAGTENLDAAKEFVEWFGSPEFQVQMAEERGKVPAHPDAIELLPPERQEAINYLSPQDIDWEIVAAKLDGWLEKIELEIIPY